jgi:hypothetical protein
VGRGVKLIYYMQKFDVGGDIRHRSAVMRKPDIPFCIDDTVQGHPPQLEEVHFLAIGSGHAMIGVRKADERKVFIFPILLENRYGVGAHSKDFRAAIRELSVAIPQARQLRAAIGSHKAAQEGKYNWLTAKIG